MSSGLAGSAMDAADSAEAAASAFGRLGLGARVLLGTSLVRFLAIGCIGLTTDATVFSVCSAVGASDAAARTLSLIAGTFVTWRLNRRFTFTASGRRVHAEAARYACVALCAQGFNLALFLTVRHLAPAVPALLALAASGATAAVFSFTGQSLVTFRARLSGGAPATFGISS